MLRLRRSSPRAGVNAELREPVRVVGLMSGTSADGIDAALVQIEERSEAEGLAITTLAYVATPYEAQLRDEVFELFSSSTSTVDKICRMNVVLGEEFARATLGVIGAAGLSPEQVHLVGCHGQTIHHLPASHATLQIGEAAVIAQRTGITTVSNFRARDMAAGGEGAPLVPYFDWLMFRHPERTRVLQNIGGIANMTVLPKGCCLQDVYAFDNGPGNMIIDYIVSSITDGKMRYDEDGAMAKRGRIHRELLNELMSNEFVLRKPPKTSGREEFGAEFTQDLMGRWKGRGVPDEDMVATATAFTAQAIVWHLKEFVMSRSGLDEVIVSGGGALNSVLMRMIGDGIAPVRVVRAEDYGMSSDGKEAIAFAVLAYETVRGRAANVPGATGASQPVLLGCITPGRLGCDLMGALRSEVEACRRSNR
ncbi:MAG: anhydro-N-acetylmuramic acid kinase [Clostridia bacterium]|nr:anhydro-N-acetylmuramic acid kinase [Clostridia bacterium]